MSDSEWPPVPDFEAERWHGWVEYTGSFGVPWQINIRHGAFSWGPDGGAFHALTYKGAKRKLERILRKRRQIQITRLGFREAQGHGDAQGWDRMFERLSELSKRR